ncbi:YaaL family protein [Pseudogracilibacillus sp. SO30301A]|uniref:YaaL family protein n=1 Tax=Pseudogracilibacillus sp. SO30301A TaxID=3098291 RepID=UPI00300DCA69
MRRRRRQKEVDHELLDVIFTLETEWKKLRYIIDNSIELMEESQQTLQLAEAKYMFLLKEAKHRRISALRY